MGLTLQDSTQIYQNQNLLEKDARLKLRLVTAWSAGCILHSSGPSWDGCLSSVQLYTELCCILPP